MDITPIMCIKEFIKLKFAIGLKTEQKILSLPKMLDKRKLILMDFMVSDFCLVHIASAG